MPALEDTRLETLARGAGAGFAETEGAGRGEVAAPDRDEAAAESRRGQLIAAVDLAPVIVQLMDLATQAGDLGTPAAMNAARGLLAEAARLKGMVETAAVEETRSVRILPPQLTTEEWVEIFGPKR